MMLLLTLLLLIPKHVAKEVKVGRDEAKSEEQNKSECTRHIERELTRDGLNPDYGDYVQIKFPRTTCHPRVTEILTPRS